MQWSPNQYVIIMFKPCDTKSYLGNYAYINALFSHTIHSNTLSVLIKEGLLYVTSPLLPLSHHAF
jgi:hypothetical protein